MEEIGSNPVGSNPPRPERLKDMVEAQDESEGRELEKDIPLPPLYRRDTDTEGSAQVYNGGSPVVFRDRSAVSDMPGRNVK
jgi:hypothetical protein